MHFAKISEGPTSTFEKLVASAIKQGVKKFSHELSVYI